ncbi:hypothetical protein L9F63_000607, partial [Diploptera punctata]
PSGRVARDATNLPISWTQMGSTRLDVVTLTYFHCVKNFNSAQFLKHSSPIYSMDVSTVRR